MIRRQPETNDTVMRIKSQLIETLFVKNEFLKQIKQFISPESTVSEIKTLVADKAATKDQFLDLMLVEITNINSIENKSTELPQQNLEVLSQLQVDLKNISEAGALRLKNEYLENFGNLIQFRTSETMRSSIFDSNMQLKENTFFVIA